MGAMGDLDPRMQGELNSISQTSYQLVLKGKAALRRGDADAAKRYFDAADMASPDARDRADIAGGLEEVQRLRLAKMRDILTFDQTGGPRASIDKFVKSPSQQVTVVIPEKLRGNAQLEKLIKEEATVYQEFETARSALQRTKSDNEGGKSSDADHARALAKYKDSVDKVVAKRKQIMTTVYQLDQD
jgi:hypothetical protein